MSTKELILAIKSSDRQSLEELLANDAEASINAGSFNGDHLSSLSLRRLDASQTEWEACIFDGTDFAEIDLTGALFNGCTFHNCKFTQCRSSELAFDGCVFHSTKLDKLEDGEALEFSNCQFKDCQIQDIHFQDACLESLTFTRSLLKNLSGSAQLKSIVLRNCQVEDFDSSDMDISACTASGSDSLPEGFMRVEGIRRRV